VSAPDRSSPTVVAFYLPIFYPVAETAAAGGPGFTGWRLVAQAQPLFPGHDQPRRPADLGFGDLRVAEVRLAQADLARAYGVDAFCYSHYWSLGRRLFERPFAEVLASGEPDFPFCLAWANESWEEIGFTQEYGADDDRAHAEFLAAVFADPRYLRVDGRPVFVVRRPERLADSSSTLGAIRAAAQRRGAGAPLFVGAVSRLDGEDRAVVGPHAVEPGEGLSRAAGFDALLDWPPVAANLERRRRRPRPTRTRFDAKLRNLVQRRRWLPELSIESERQARARSGERATPAGRIASVLVGWDDTPVFGRRGAVLDERSPLLFERELETALARAQRGPSVERLVFLYAWNAWLDGAVLEPDERFGRAYLSSVALARVRLAGLAKGEGGR
jgi:O-antigen biosynthesis protein